MKKTKKIRCGELFIGADAPITIQSMTNVDSRDEKGLLRQIDRLCEAGCDIVRIAVPDMESAEVFSRVRKKVPCSLPLVADIHFDYRLALVAINAGADKIRINPGNIGERERLRAVVEAAKEHEIPIRVGVNSGSLEKPILAKYGRVTAEGLAESAMNNLRLIEEFDYDKMVVSIKSSDVKLNYDAHRIADGLSDSYRNHRGRDTRKRQGEIRNRNRSPAACGNRRHDARFFNRRSGRGSNFCKRNFEKCRTSQGRNRPGFLPDLRTNESRFAGAGGRS